MPCEWHPVFTGCFSFSELIGGKEDWSRICRTDMLADEARVSISSLEAETIMKSTPVQTVKSILGRIGIEYEDGLPKEAYISDFERGVCSEPKWVLLMLPKVMFRFFNRSLGEFCHCDDRGNAGIILSI